MLTGKKLRRNAKLKIILVIFNLNFNVHGTNNVYRMP